MVWSCRPSSCEGFGNQFVGDAVAAARAIVRLVLQFGLALVFVVEHRRLGVDYLVSLPVNLALLDQALRSLP